MAKIAQFWIMLLLSFNLHASEVGKIISIKKNKDNIVFNCENSVKVKIGLVAADIIRVQVSNDNEFSKSMMIEWGYVKEELEPVD